MARALALCLLILSLTLGSQNLSAQVTSTKEGYLFRKKFTVGTIWRYRMSTAVVMGASRTAPKGTSVSHTSAEVKSVEKGVAAIHLVDRADRRGRPANIINERTVKVDTLGKVDGNVFGGGIFSMALPEQPIKVGQRITVRLSGGTDGKEVVHHVLRFMGMGVLGKQKYAHWELTTAGKGTTRYKGTGDLYIDLTDGSLFRSRVILEAPLKQEGKLVRLLSNTEIRRE
jgi:hypothetical protein